MIYRSNTYFGNYFCNISLFATLRDMGVGACGTARISTVPESVHIDKALARKELKWNYLQLMLKIMYSVGYGKTITLSYDYDS